MGQIEDALAFRHAVQNITEVFKNYKDDDKIRKLAIKIAKRCSKKPIKLSPEFYVSLIYFFTDKFTNMDGKAKALAKLYFINATPTKLIMEMIVKNFKEKNNERYSEF